MTIDLSQIEDIVNESETVAAALAPFLGCVPVLGPYVGAITLAIPQIIKATHAVEQALSLPVDSAENEQKVADAINPTKPDNIPVAAKSS